MNASTRRDFLGASTQFLGAGWLLLNLPLLASLSACAREAARSSEPFTILTEAEAAAMRALAARILPSDETPGAEEAGAVYFVDLALAGPFAGMLEIVRPGLAELDGQTERRGAARFADLSPEAQDEAIRAVQDTPFFANARMLTVMGVLADPSHAGNREGAGDRMMGFTHAPVWQPPFGHYDAPYTPETVEGVAE
jgi:gluconate 2-dehydrogenase gamma chain